MKILAEPIGAIVVFREKDLPRPYKFRFHDHDGCLREIKVDRILQTEESKIAGNRALIYRCQSEIDGVSTLYELKYLIAEYRWQLYKM